MNTLPEPQLTIFEGTRRDLDEVMTVMVDAFDPDFGEAWSRTQCAGLLGQPGVWLSLVRVGEEAAGFVLARMTGDEAELLLIGVRPRFRRMGIGRKLLERTFLAAASLGARRLHLEVREGNSAEQLYRESGFEQIGRRVNYYRGQGGKCFDAITLAVPLRPSNNGDETL